MVPESNSSDVTSECELQQSFAEDEYTIICNALSVSLQVEQNGVSVTFIGLSTDLPHISA